MSSILVTGANGFLASHIVLQLLEAGHKVKGTVRSAKAAGVRDSIGDKYPNLELVTVDDIASADLNAAMKDVSAVIHVAVPLPFGGANAEENLSNVVEGILNVLRQAVKNGISKVVLTSSWSATFDPDMKQAFQGLLSTEKDWGNVTKEEFLNGEHDPSWYYLASKVLSERAAWEFAKREPKLDLAVIIPPFIFGPYAEGFPLPNVAMLGSNAHIYGILNGNTPFPVPPLICDVRDVAKAHILALNAPPVDNENLEEKRFLVCGGIISWKDMVERLRVLRPELADRIPGPKAAYNALPGPITTIDSSRAENILGMKEYIKIEKTFVDTVDSLLEAEKA